MHFQRCVQIVAFLMCQILQLKEEICKNRKFVTNRLDSTVLVITQVKIDIDHPFQFT